jgi:hypothetical protein
MSRHGRTDHLNERATTEKLPSLWNLGRIFKKESCDIALRHSRGEVRVGLGRRFLKGGEGSYISRIAAGEATPYMRPDRERCVTGRKRIPNGIIERRVAAEP